MNNLSELKKDILMKGIIDKQTVEQLHDIVFAGNGIDKENANRNITNCGGVIFYS
jgi:hypothetical protein